MRILVISFYYEPDLCAGSFRASAFIKALKRNVSPDDVIDVITTFPNRYSSFRADTAELEKDGTITIKRIRVPSHRSGLFDQTRSFLVYFINALRFAWSREYDVVFATSSRLFSAFLGAVIAKWKHAGLYLDIRDIFTDTLESIFKNKRLKYIIPVIAFIERITMQSADRINLVSKGFSTYFQEKYNARYSYFTNGIDDDFLTVGNSAQMATSSDKTVFTYTGNIGEGQGLEKIVPAIASRYSNIEFIIIGDGGRRKALEKSTSHLQNVRLLPPMKRSKLFNYYQASDVLFLHLNNYDAFKRVLPSKIFEYGALFKPIVAGVDGYAKEFIKEHLSDSLVFRPCDVDDFCKQYDVFSRSVDRESRKRFVSRFSRQNIMNQMVADFLDFSRHEIFAKSDRLP